MLEDFPTGGYQELYDAFRWRIPAEFNIAVACADRHPAGDLALVAVDGSGRPRNHTFGSADPAITG